MDNSKKYLAYLHSVGFSQKNLLNLFSKKQNYKVVFNSVSESLLDSLKISGKQKSTILERYESFQCDVIDQILDSQNIQLVTLNDDIYPQNLKEISQVPYVLYVRGNIGDSCNIAVIGSRKITPYGKRCISQIVSGLVPHTTIVSGGALGCDGEAHKIAIESGGKTIVVLGSGINVLYPRSHINLFENVLQTGGAIISIFRIGEEPNKYTFPVRNEIISGISRGVLVIEAGEKSGTQITANLALEQGRDMFVVPGEIDKLQSIGCNRMIQRGEAKIVLDAKDILEEYMGDIAYNENKEVSFDDDEEKGIYKLLSRTSCNIEEISDKITISIPELLMKISQLEMKKLIQKNIEGKYELL